MAAQLSAEWREFIVERLAPVEPRQIFPFGSRARGDARDDSDLDLLVVADADGDADAAMSRALDPAPFENASAGAASGEPHMPQRPFDGDFAAAGFVELRP
jgi:Nucleotidyltransferase domain